MVLQRAQRSGSVYLDSISASISGTPVFIDRELSKKSDGHRVGAIALQRFREERALDLRGAQRDIADNPA